MKCIYCGTPLSGIDYCSGCGADVTILKRIVRISNLLYNEGLEKAQVRDLSGAISCLKRSLKFNKENIDARNLLGLCYYETGEVVAALGEWVISKNTVEEENAADFYIAKLQSNKNKLEMINTTIRKYNQALLYCKQDDEDMAVIQLKKVLTQNPNLIKAYHLLSLIYMKQQDYEKARKLLKKAAQIDTTNTTTLRYLNEVEEATGVGTNLKTSSRKFKKSVDAEDTEKRFLGPITYKHGNDTVIQPPTFRDSSSTATFLNIALGFVLGAAIIWFLVIPSNTRKINHSASQQVTDANTKLASESAKVQELEKQIEEYQSKIDNADDTMDKAQKKADGYEVLLKAVNEYLNGDQNTAGATLSDVDKESLDSEAIKLYEMIEGNVKASVYSALYAEGANAFATGDYTTAAEKLKKATETDPSQYDAWYYLSFSYYYLNDTENADKTLAETIVRFPAYESILSQYIKDQTVLSKAKTDGKTDTTGDGAVDTSGTDTTQTWTDQTQTWTDTTQWGTTDQTQTWGTDQYYYDNSANYGYTDTYNYGYTDTTNYGYTDTSNYGYTDTYNYGTTGYYDAYGNWVQY